MCHILILPMRNVINVGGAERRGGRGGGKVLINFDFMQILLRR